MNFLYLCIIKGKCSFSIYITSKNNNQTNYQPGLDRWSLYKSIWKRHWKEFERIYSDNYELKYGPLDSRKKMEVHKLLFCGDFSRGFYRYQCRSCQTELILPFSCKSRLCLSCYRKKLFGWSVNLSRILSSDFTYHHITLTIPGRLQKILEERNFKPEVMNRLAAHLYQREIRRYNFKNTTEWLSGIISTVHKCGNGLNYNPHVHMIATRELVDVNTGELLLSRYVSYKKFRFLWQDILLRYLVRKKLLTKAESAQFRRLYRNGFHVYFQPISGTQTDILFRTAEYLASGYFHNSQIVKVDNENRKITFSYRSWIERKTGKKQYSILTMDIFEFMARMLYFLPDPHQKSVRYYGLYAASHRKARETTEKQSCSWSSGIENSFESKPEFCPDCGCEMVFTIIYSYQASSLYRFIRSNYVLREGYFKPVRGP